VESFSLALGCKMDVLALHPMPGKRGGGELSHRHVRRRPVLGLQAEISLVHKINLFSELFIATAAVAV